MKDIQSFPMGIGRNIDESGHIQEGMTLRDYFAGQVIIGLLCAKGQIGDEVLVNEDKAATWAYSQADAMLAQREEE